MIIYHSQTATRLNKRADIKVLAESPVKDELGQYPIIEQKVCSVWCAIIPQTGSMLNGRKADTELTKTTHKIIIRYREDITDNMWIEAGGETYKILYILNPYLERETLEIFCEVKHDGQ